MTSITSTTTYLYMCVNVVRVLRPLRALLMRWPTGLKGEQSDACLT